MKAVNRIQLRGLETMNQRMSASFPRILESGQALGLRPYLVPPGGNNV